MPGSTAPPPRQAPVFFPSGDDTIFGIVTTAVGGRAGPAGSGVVIASGGLTGTSTVGRNQLYVRLARDLAADGFPSLRFDYHGMGESTGVLEEFRLDAEAPFVEDILGAARCLAELGATETILLGKCFGSRMALSSAGDLDSLAGVILIGPPVRDFGKGERTVARLATELNTVAFLRKALRPAVLRNLADRRHRTVYLRAATAKLRAVSARLRQAPAAKGREQAFWVSPRFFSPLEELVERGVPVQLIYGVDDDFYQDFRKASRNGRLAELLERAGPLVEVTEIEGLVRGFAHASGQAAIIAAARQWLQGLRSRSTTPLPA